jgi:hypothetical protein
MIKERAPILQHHTKLYVVSAYFLMRLSTLLASRSMTHQG